MLTFVATPIGNLADVTFRALEALQKADVVLAEDTRVAKRLLQLLSERYQIDFGQKRFISFHEHNQKEFFTHIDPSFFEQCVVFVSDAGMPSISDPGASLVRYAQEHGITYEVLPGPNAALTAWVASGYEGVFTFFGFLPHKKGRKEELQKVLQHPYHAILYEAPHRLLKLLEEIASAEPARELFLAKELTKKYERFYKGTAKELLEELAKEQIRGEWVVVIAPVAKQTSAIDYQSILELDIPKKEKAKLLSKITGEPVKVIYEKLINN